MAWHAAFVKISHLPTAWLNLLKRIFLSHFFVLVELRTNQTHEQSIILTSRMYVLVENHAKKITNSLTLPTSIFYDTMEVSRDNLFLQDESLTTSHQAVLLLCLHCFAFANQ